MESNVELEPTRLGGRHGACSSSTTTTSRGGLQAHWHVPLAHAAAAAGRTGSVRVVANSTAFDEPPGTGTGNLKLSGKLEFPAGPAAAAGRAYKAGCMRSRPAGRARPTPSPGGRYYY
jgi:hypothetical protein